MTDPLPKWIQVRYAALWKKFGATEFSFEKAEKVLKDNAGINVFFSDLRKAGWVTVSLDEKDTRRRVYKLKSPIDAINEMVNEK